MLICLHLNLTIDNLALYYSGSPVPPDPLSLLVGCVDGLTGEARGLKEGLSPYCCVSPFGSPNFQPQIEPPCSKLYL